MLTRNEVNKVQGLLSYLNAQFKAEGTEIMLNDAEFIDSNGEAVAKIGYDAGANEYVLKSVNP